MPIQLLPGAMQLDWERFSKNNTAIRNELLDRLGTDHERGLWSHPADIAYCEELPTHSLVIAKTYQSPYRLTRSGYRDWHVIGLQQRQALQIYASNKNGLTPIARTLEHARLPHSSVKGVAGNLDDINSFHLKRLESAFRSVNRNAKSLEQSVFLSLPHDVAEPPLQLIELHLAMQKHSPQDR